MTLPRIDLAPGYSVSRILKGGWQLAGGHGAIDRATAIDRSLTRLGIERLELVQFHWWDYRVPRYLESARWLDDLRRAGIQLLCYGGVAGGFLSDRYQALLRVLQAVAARHAVSIATVALRSVLEQSRVAGVIVGARHHRHLADLQRVETLALTPVDLAEIAGVQAGARGPAGDVYELERVPGGVHASIMRYTLNSAIR